MSVDSAVEAAVEQRQQQAALGWEHTEYRIECPVCSDPGVLVSTRTRPAFGPLDFDGYTKHATEDGTVYHNESDTTDD